MESFENIIKSFYVKDELNPKIWENPEDPSNAKMKDDIRERLLEIANEFISFLGLEIFIQDVTMTGSLANYNWSEFSDVDLHIMYDFNESGDKKDLVAELFKLKKTLFNSTHDIKVKGYDVELYVQDTNEEHFSSGVYSVLFDEWVHKPEKEDVKIDKEILKGKTENMMSKVDALIEDVSDDELDTALAKIEKFKDKLKKYRSAGLEKDGEFSYENLVFKFLRRNGYIDKLFDFKNKLMDKSLSLETKEVE